MQGWKKTGFADKSAIARFINNTDINMKIATLATKAELKSKKDKVKSYKHLIKVIFAVRINLKMMALKIIQCFNRLKDILKGLLILVKLQRWNQKNSLTKVFSLLQLLIIVLMQEQIIIIILKYE